MYTKPNKMVDVLENDRNCNLTLCNINLTNIFFANSSKLQSFEKATSFIELLNSSKEVAFFFILLINSSIFDIVFSLLIFDWRSKGTKLL